MHNFKKRFVGLTSVLTVLATGFTMPGMQVYSYAEEAQKPIVTSKQKASGWTYGIYMCGHNLEEYGYHASDDLLEIMNAKVPKGFSNDNNFIVETGGCLGWHFREQYETYLKEQGYDDSEINQIVPDEINSSTISLFKINFEHEYKATDGTTKTVPALEFVKVVAEYPEVDEYFDGEIEYSEDKPANMGNEIYLKQFINELDTNYPAEHMALTLWNHGGGITGGACYDQYYDDPITLGELKNVLKERAKAGYDKLDMIGYDACLMSNYESWINVAPFVKVGVGSLTSEPSPGWYYTSFVEELGKHYKEESYTADKFSSAIVDTYRDYYKKDGQYFKDSGELADEESAAYAMLSAVNLEKLSYSAVDFAIFGSSLLENYRDSEGIKNIFEEAIDKGGIEAGAEIVGINSLLDATQKVANDRIPVFENSERIYDRLYADSYNKCLDVIPNIKEKVNESIINTCNGWEGNELENVGCMSVFCPDKYASDDIAYFNYSDYSSYSVSHDYAKLVYLYGGSIERNAERVIDVKPEITYNAADGSITASVEHAREDATEMKVIYSEFIKKDGINYVTDYKSSIPFFNEFSLAVKPKNVYYTIGDSKPLFTRMVEDKGYKSCTIQGILNNYYGIFYFTDKEKNGKYIFAGFWPDVDLSAYTEEERLQVIEEASVESMGEGLLEGSNEFFEEMMAKGEIITEISSGDYINLTTATVDECTLAKVNDVSNRIRSNVIVKADSVDEFMLKENVANKDDEFIVIGTTKYVGEVLGFDENGFPIMASETHGLETNYGKYKDFVNGKISIEKNEYELTGEYIKPVIKFENSRLEEGKDYEVIYENNLGLGRAKAVIKGLGTYAYLPERTIEFDIVKVKNAEGKTVYSVKTVIVKTPKQAKIKSVKNKRKALTIKWKKIKAVNGYEVLIARNKKFTKGKKIKTIKDSNKASVAFKNLKKKKTYFVKVRAYKVAKNGKKVYGDWSEVKKVKICK